MIPSTILSINVRQMVGNGLFVAYSLGREAIIGFNSSSGLPDAACVFLIQHTCSKVFELIEYISTVNY